LSVGSGKRALWNTDGPRPVKFSLPPSASARRLPGLIAFGDILARTRPGSPLLISPFAIESSARICASEARRRTSRQNGG